MFFINETVRRIKQNCYHAASCYLGGRKKSKRMKHLQMHSITRPMKIIMFTSFPHFLKTYSPADLVLPVFPHAIFCTFWQLSIYSSAISHHSISVRFLSPIKLSSEGNGSCNLDNNTCNGLLWMKFSFTLPLCRIKGSERVADCARNEKPGEDRLLGDLVITFSLEIYTHTALVVPPRQAFITALLGNRLIDLTEMNLLGAWQQMHCFLSHHASQIREGSSKAVSGPTTRFLLLYSVALMLGLRKACIPPSVTAASQPITLVMLLGNTRPREPVPNHFSAVLEAKEKSYFCRTRGASTDES